MDYYKILGVSKTSTDDEIHSAYKKLAFQYHPDINPNNASKFKEITEAFENLRDKNKRNIYDNKSKQNYAPKLDPLRYEIFNPGEGFRHLANKFQLFIGKKYPIFQEHLFEKKGKSNSNDLQYLVMNEAKMLVWIPYYHFVDNYKERKLLYEGNVVIEHEEDEEYFYDSAKAYYTDNDYKNIL